MFTKASQIGYLDSSNMGAIKLPKMSFDVDDERTPIEVWLDRVQRNLVVVR